MCIKKSACIDCNCNEVSHSIKPHGGKLIDEGISFSCCALKNKNSSIDDDVAKVEFLGCNCAD